MVKKYLKKFFCKANSIDSLPLDELGEFVDWITDIKFRKYKEGWCEAGGSNGWHCSTAELIKMFKDRNTRGMKISNKIKNN